MLRLPLLVAAAVIAIWVAPSLVGPAGAATTMVMANSATSKFEPATVTIAPGDSVMWMGVPGHTVTSDSVNWSINESSDTTFTFPAAGTYTYHCEVHGKLVMSGTVVVGADGAATSTPTTTPSPTVTSVASATATTTRTPVSQGRLVALLTGAAENPPTGSAGTGSVTLTLDAAAGTVTGTWNVTGMTSSIVAAHIHRGAPGVNGPVVVPFTGVPPGGGSFSTADVATGDLIREILADPGGFYVNVHTSTNAGGEVRGALSPPTDCGSATLGASLLPANEVPPRSAGATGGVTLAFDGAAGTIAGRWSVGGATSNIVAAHIHQNAAGANGPIVSPFAGVPTAGGQFTTSSTGVAPQLIANILANPVAFYVNVHTSTNASGETRGQLGCLKVWLPLIPRSSNPS